MDKIKSRSINIEYVNELSEVFNDITHPEIRDNCYNFRTKSVDGKEEYDYIIPLHRIHTIEFTTFKEEV